MDNQEAQCITSKASQLSLGNGSATSVYPYEDVTALLESATQDMKVGQLVQVQTFSLFDAMCAIVIMDPKMDTGMILDDYAACPQYDVNRPLDPKEFIWIFDNILMTWLSGHALSQTLFTSCYVLRLFEIDPNKDSTGISADNTLQDSSTPPMQFVTVVLKACVLAVTKSCGLIWAEMKKGQVYEEEDFLINKFGVSLYESYPTASLIAMLDQAEYWMQGTGASWIESNYGPDAPNILQGVMDRILYARSLLDEASSSTTPGFLSLEANTGATNQSSYMSLFQVTTPKCSLFVAAIHQLESTRNHLKGLQATHSLSTQVDGAFDHAVHRKLVTNTPPRAIALLSSKETFEQLDQLWTDLLFIANALHFPDATSLMNFFIYFGNQKPAPGAFPRSILQTVLYEDRVIMGTCNVHSVVRDIIQETVKPAPWIFENFDTLQAELESANTSRLNMVPEVGEDEFSLLKGQIQAHAVLFVEKATKPFVDTLQIMGQNTSRQRRNLRKIVLLWETLQGEAEVFDEEIHLVMGEMQAQQGNEAIDPALSESALRPFYLVSWVYHMKLWVMEWLLLLGSELELYSTFEFSMIYGYVEYVVGVHAQHLQRVQTVMSLKDTTDKDSSPSALRSQPAMLQLTSIKAQMARGVFHVLAALTQVGHLSTNPPHVASHGLNDLETLFDHRFKAFHHLSSPETMTYSHYIHKMECDGCDSSELLNYANHLFSDAKSSLDRLQSLTAKEAHVELCEQSWQKDIKNMSRVCIASKVAIASLQKDARVLELKQHRLDAQRRSIIAANINKAKGKGKGKGAVEVSTAPSSIPSHFQAAVRKVHFEWKYHPWWPVVSLGP
ncbi:hypothetical protein BGZ50_006922 [Haplosporangium sp. Z 11]|nr:hypothetical protein BGZ50_006922 [Haplosporangium sp. Z 11]